MKKLFLIIILFLPSVALSQPPVPPSQDMEEVLRIQRAYDGIVDIKGTFTQRNHIKDLKKTTTYTGEFFIKRPSKMRWSYKGQDLIINNETLIMYQKKEQQAFKGRFNPQTHGQTPVALLNGFAEITNEFEVTKKAESLLLKPRHPMGGVSLIEIEPAQEGFPIKFFKVSDIYSNTIEVTLKDIEINTGVKDSVFEPSLPEGVKVYEYNP